MRLRANLARTDFDPPRGLGAEALPDTGAQELLSSTFHSLDEVRAAKSLGYEAGRLFLGRVDDQMVGVRDNRHIVTIAGSRSGKSSCLLIPNLFLYPGAALVIDPKGELAEVTARHRAEVLGQKVVVLDPFDIAKGDARAYRQGHDPLQEVDVGGPDLIDDVALIAEALVLDTGGDQHWTMAARNLLNGLILFALIQPERATLSQIRAGLASDPDFLFSAMSEFRPLEDDRPSVLEAAELVRQYGASFQHKNDREGPAIISSALEQIAFLQSPAMRAQFETHGASLSELKDPRDDRPVTFYIVLPAGRMGTHSRWLRLLVTLALTMAERSPTQPHHPVLMVLEEFAALGHLRPVEQAAGFIAGAGVRLWSVLQDINQLKTHYKDGWETFLGNAGVLQAFSVSDLSTCEYLSKRLGETTVEITNKHDVNSTQEMGGDTGLRREFRSVPLLSPAELAIQFARVNRDGASAGGLALVIMPELRPFAVDRVHWSDLE